MAKSPDAFRTISEVADWLGIQAHVLRFWESKFNQIKPVKRAGGRRYYRPADMMLLGGIRKLLHDDGLTIKGVQKILREQGVAHVSSLSHALEEPLEAEAIAAAGDVGDTVVPFQARGDRDHAKPEQIDMVLDSGLEDEDEEDAAEAAPEPPARPKPVEPGALPSFLNRPKEPRPEPAPEPETVQGAEPAEELEAAQEPVAEPETALEPVAARGATVEPAEPAKAKADAPEEDDIPVKPGVLIQLARLDRLSPEQARAAAPLARELRRWLKRNRTLRYG